MPRLTETWGTTQARLDALAPRVARLCRERIAAGKRPTARWLLDRFPWSSRAALMHLVGALRDSGDVPDWSHLPAPAPRPRPIGPARRPRPPFRPDAATIGERARLIRERKPLPEEREVSP